MGFHLFVLFNFSLVFNELLITFTRVNNRNVLHLANLPRIKTGLLRSYLK